MRALTVAVVAVVACAGSAQARPVATPDVDVCRNMAGVQTANMLRLGWVVLDTSTRRPNDCTSGWGA